MSGSDRMFISADDASIAQMIDRATHRVIFVAPGLDKLTGLALVRSMKRNGLSLTVIVDADPEAYRLGYGDPAALKELHRGASEAQVPLRQQAGLRVGLLVADAEVAVWSPVARSVDAGGTGALPNGILLSGHPTGRIEEALGAEGSNVLPGEAEVGRDALTPDELVKVIEDLERNPPAPFDLTRRTRVFSSRFQFVEFEIRGAQWTERKINLSSVLLNADLPEALRDLLDTQIRPYQERDEPSFAVPHLVGGVRAFDATAKRILVPASQTQVLKYWSEIRDRYLTHLLGFGWLIKRDELEAFREASGAFEETLRSWVEAFRSHAGGREESLVQGIVTAIRARVSRSDQQDKLKKVDLDAEVRRGLARMRVIEPEVRVVLKNVAWESTRDSEFQNALEQALPAKDREGWFEEFTAARERKPV